MIQWMLAIGYLVPLPFLDPAWTSGISWFMYCWGLAWKILSITLLMCEMSNCAIVWRFFGSAFLWDWNENWPFQSCSHCWVFQICWHIECRTFIASSFRIWNNSAGILLPPLSLFIVKLPKAHLTSESRMSNLYLSSKDFIGIFHMPIYISYDTTSRGSYFPVTSLW